MKLKPNQLLLASIVLVASVAIPAPATAAPTDDAPFIDHVLGLDDKSGTLSSIDEILAFADGKRSRYIGQARALVSGEDPEPEKELEQVQDYYNQHSAEFQQYVNDRVAGEQVGEHNVVKITFKHEGETATKYLVADVTDGGTYANARIQDTNQRDVESYVELDDGHYLVTRSDGSIDTVDSLTYEVDDTVTAEGFAVTQAREELGTFYEEYVTSENDADRTYLVRMAAKYGSAVDTSLDGDADE